MKTFKASLLAVVMIASAVLGAFVPRAAHAEWAAEVLVSSSLVRFEAQPVAYDATANKYKYKFSWLMPANRTYSFMIDGKMYLNVTKNGVVETPYWFSPSINYSIQIYPQGNGKGTMLSEGRFTAPSITPPAPTHTIEEEYAIIDEYIESAPRLPKGSVKSQAEEELIVQLLETTKDLNTIESLYPYMSAQSREMFVQTPLFAQEYNDAMNEEDNDEVVKVTFKLLKGKTYATLKFKLRDLDTRKIDYSTLVFVKENGAWRFDFVQIIKIVIES